MNYIKTKDYIEVLDKNEFNIGHILECGQVFCFDKIPEKYIVFPSDKYAEIVETENGYRINTKDVDYFENWFALDEDYGSIKSKLSVYDILKKPIEFGYGIRILRQDLFETLISFIISANNNIKRIKLILNNIREALGESTNFGKKSFPSFERLKACDATFFKNVGAGYRADYLVKVLNQITPEKLEEYKSLPTNQLRAKLIELSGVGPKVADCILLFGYNRFDVFPVDTWIHQMYNKYFSPLENREIIAKKLVEMFGNMSGYAQQYLFYFQRSIKE